MLTINRNNSAELTAVHQHTNNSREIEGTSESEATVQWHDKRPCRRFFFFFIFTSIAMTAGIVIVCLTARTPSKSCQSSFRTLIHESSIKYDSNPRSIATGDLNNDTFLDLVVANPGTNNIGIFLNYGNGTFAPQITVSTSDSSRPLSVVVDDLNNDTHLDIVVANYDTHNIGIFLGYGNGTFASQITFSTGASRPVSVTIADVNNDHWLDLVITNNGTNDIGIVLGYGNGSFTNQIRYSTGYDSLTHSAVVADLSGDHYPDIVVANYGTDNVGIFLGYGNGSFTTQTTYSTSPGSRPYSIAIDDFNHDRQLDIAVANSGTNNVGIFFGYGNGSLQRQTTYSISPQSNLRSISIADFNQDNLLDIAVSDYGTNNVSILTGYGNGSFAPRTMHSTGIDSGPFGMTVGDFDNNNQTDIAVVNYVTNNIFVLIGYYMKQSDNPTAYSTGVDSAPNQIAIGDLDNDTEIDLVVANIGTNNVGVFFGYGNGSFREQITYSTGENSRPTTVSVGDVDDDHRLDIIVGNSNTQSVGILYGYGNGTFTTIVSYFSGNFSSLRSVTVNDFNNDNHLDIVFADFNTNNIGILLGYGNRTFATVVTYSSGVGSRPYSVAAGDFNNDGRIDLTAACFGTNNIVILLGSDDGTFTLFSNYSTGDGSLPIMLTTADLNKDTHLDIIVANSYALNAGVFLGYGNGTFATQVTFFTGSASLPMWISVADFNNDHSLDLAVVNNNNNNVGIFLGNSSGSFGIQTTYSTGASSGPASIAVGNFNRDTRLDIAVANFATNNIVILLGHPNDDFSNQTVERPHTNSQSASTTYTSDVPILLGDRYATFRNQTNYTTGSSNRPYSLVIGDVNNDKQMDIIVANSGNANLGILLGDGNGSFASETIYSLAFGSNPRNVIGDDFNNDKLLDVAVIDPRNDNLIVLLGNGNGTFSTELTYFIGSSSNPSALAAGNFNNDNYLDLVVANTGTNTIDIFFGLDYTIFVEQPSFIVGDGSSPRSIAMGDFNNDGHLDIVSGLYTWNKVGVFLGYGNGIFTSVMIFADIPASRPWSVAVGDFNNDNQLDITIALWGVDSVGVILGYGNGSFTNPILFSVGVGARPVYVAIGDFNNDHQLDIVTANYGGNSIGVFLGYGNGSFRDVLIFLAGKGSSTSSVAVVDINNDTQLDVIVANYGTDSVGVFLGHGNGSFAEQMTFSSGDNSAPWSAVAGDFDKDGRLDLTVANYGTGNMGVLYGYGNGTFGNLQTYPTGIGSSPTNVKVADFNNDSQLDVIVGDDSLTSIGVFFGYGDGTFTSVSVVQMRQGAYTYGLVVGDFNKDNQLDFAVANTGNNNIGVFLASGSAPFGGQTTFFIGERSHPSSVAVGHFNNDNHLDIAVANSGTDSIGILFGYGNRLFSNITTYSTGDDSNPMSLAVGDFNNDFLTDIVVANSQTDNIVVFIGYGNGNFSVLTTYSMGTSAEPVCIAVGNFNKDDRLDIAVANFGTNNVCVLFGYGNGTFTNQTWYPLGYDSRPNWVVSKDLNSDGRDDIAVVTYGIDNVNILLNIC